MIVSQGQLQDHVQGLLAMVGVGLLGLTILAALAAGLLLMGVTSQKEESDQ